MREKVSFAGRVAWHYPGSNGACVVMTGGAGVTKEPGTDRFAARFQEAGFSVLVFDYRRFGESEGHPRQVVRVREQLADWRAAIGFAGGLPGVDPDRLAIWSFSLSGGHIFRLAAAHAGPTEGHAGPAAGNGGTTAGHVRSGASNGEVGAGRLRVAAAIAQSANVDGLAAARNAMRYTTAGAFARLFGRAVLDGLGSLVGRPPLLVPTSGPSGTVALLSTPDSLDGTRALDPHGRYPDWQQEIAARFVLRAGSYNPGRVASKVDCPLLVVVCDEDRTALAEPAVRAARRAPRGELVRLPGGHYAPFLDAHEQAVEAELAFLRRHLLKRDAAVPRTGRA